MVIQLLERATAAVSHAIDQQSAAPLLAVARAATQASRGFLVMFDDNGAIEDSAWSGREVDQDLLDEVRSIGSPSLLTPHSTPDSAPSLVIPIDAGRRAVLWLDGFQEGTAAEWLALAQPIGDLISAWLLSATTSVNTVTSSRELDPGIGAVLASPRLTAIRNRLSHASVADEPVYLVGDAGTEKRNLALWSHHTDPRRSSGRFVDVTCASVDNAGTALFGPDDGSPGALDAAMGGTLYLAGPELLLDEVQDRLADLLFRSSGIGIYVIAGSHAGPEQPEKIGGLRPGLARWFDGGHVSVPRLRGHTADIASLTDWILLQLPPGPDGAAHVASDLAMWQLQNFDWPGNIDELREVLESAAARSGVHPISPKHLPVRVREREVEPDQEFDPLCELERKYILEVMRTVHTKRKAAEILGIAPSTLYDKIARYGILP